MSSERISAELAGVVEARGQADHAHTATTDSGTSASTAAERTQQELGDITETLRGNFNTSVTTLQDRFAQFRTEVNLSDWDGNAKQRANAVADRYEAALRRVAANATTSVDDFGRTTMTEADNLRTDISVHYQGITEQFGDRYTSLGLALQGYHDELELLDATAIAED